MNSARDSLRQQRNKVVWCRIDPAGPGLHEPKLPGDIGWDLEAAEDMVIPPMRAVDVPTNIRMAMPYSVWGEIRARSSIARRGLQVDSGTIDPGYRGPLFVLVRNMALPANSSAGTDFNSVTIEAGERVGQVVFHAVAPLWAQEIPEAHLDAQFSSERGVAGFGSTGK